MSHTDFSSWPREQEATFVVFEETVAASQKKAWTIAGAIAAVWFIAAVGIYAGVKPEIHDISKDMNMSNLTKKDAKAAAPAAEDKPAAEAKPAEAPAAPAEAPAAPAAESK